MPEPVEPPVNPPAAPPAPPVAPQFTQADLDKIAGNARQDGRAAGQKELLEALGVQDIDAAKVRIEAAKAAEDAQKTELQRLVEERDAAKAEAAKQAQVATTALVVTRLEGALRDAGLKGQRLASALRLADLGSLKVEGTEVKGVAEAVAAVKEASPEWFGPPTSPPDASLGAPGTPDYRTDREAAAQILHDQYGIRT